MGTAKAPNRRLGTRGRCITSECSSSDIIAIAEYVDRLVTVEIRLAGLPRNVTIPLYEACRRAQQGPLTYLAAKSLLERLVPDSHVLLVTGAGMPPWLPFGETDGPLGVASLARALDLALGVKPVFVVQPNHARPVVAAVTAAGLTVVDEPIFRARRHAALFATVEPGIEAGEARARELLREFEPGAVIFIEKIGPNRAGYYHGVLGYSRAPSEVANVVPLLDLARAAGVLTIGIGDGGNEIGFGLIEEEVRAFHPYGAMCRCPCGRGITTPATTDVVVAASVSNWGAYGVVACLSLATRDPELLHGPYEESLMLERCVEAGAADGATGRQTISVDGTPLETNMAIVTLLRSLVRDSLRTSDRNY